MATSRSPVAERYVETTLQLIASEGGSPSVNLREVSRRVGFAHTNLYNYFTSYQDLLWEAFRRALRIYARSFVTGLDDSMAPLAYAARVFQNLADFPQEHPGLYRFIASDPIPNQIPADILATVTTMKTWLSDTLDVVAGQRLGPQAAQAAADIVLAYLDGETLNLINGRQAPGEDIQSRIERNALRVFELLIRDEAGSVASTPPGRGYPKLLLTEDSGAD